MPITVRCECGKVYHVKDELAGRTGRCKACNQSFKIPAAGPPPLPVERAADPQPAAPEPAKAAAPDPPAKSWAFGGLLKDIRQGVKEAAGEVGKTIQKAQGAIRAAANVPTQPTQPPPENGSAPRSVAERVREASERAARDQAEAAQRALRERLAALKETLSKQIDAADLRGAVQTAWAILDIEPDREATEFKAFIERSHPELLPVNGRCPSCKNNVIYWEKEVWFRCPHCGEESKAPPTSVAGKAVGWLFTLNKVHPNEGVPRRKGPGFLESSCRHCGTTIPFTALNCPGCGRGAMQCPYCCSDISAAARVCPHCTRSL